MSTRTVADVTAGRSILNPRLTETGRAQAVGLAAQLQAEGARFDVCVTTPLARAVETAHLAFGSAATRFIVTPEAVETADPKLAGPQRGHSKEQMVSDFPFLAQWDVSLSREDNWVLSEAIEPTDPDGGRCGAAYINPVDVSSSVASNLPSCARATRGAVRGAAALALTRR